MPLRSRVDHSANRANLNTLKSLSLSVLHLQHLEFLPSCPSKCGSECEWLRCFRNPYSPRSRKGSQMATGDELITGVINPAELYTLQAFTQRLGIRASTLRSARRAGLRVYYVHKHGYVYGRDWIEYVLKSKVRHDNSSSPDSV